MKSKNTQSAVIGIFDSGIGGLTVANAIRQSLPGESIIYFGDTAHLPYGEKSAESIIAYSKEISNFLLSKNCKAIVIACNTASSIAYEAVKKIVQGKALVINVIDPVVNFVAKNFSQKNIGVIGTKATIRSDIYSKKLKERNSSLMVSSLATPLLAPMVEEGFFNNKISRTIINSYLSRPKIKNIDALILACTHYPLIRPEIEEYYNHKIKIIDSAEIVASFVLKELKKKKLLKKSGKAQQHFFVSDFTPSFEKSTKLFFKGKIKLEHFPIWK